MSVRMWGNQHGHGATLDGEDAEIVRNLATVLNCSEQEAFERILREALLETKKPPLAERPKDC